MSEEDKNNLPVLSQMIRPKRTNARESVEINAKIRELVVGQMNAQKDKDNSKNRTRRCISLKDRLKKKKKGAAEVNQINEDIEEESKSESKSESESSEENSQKEE